jgi:negative regulator of flagellin synthesis FlgM
MKINRPLDVGAGAKATSAAGPNRPGGASRPAGAGTPGGVDSVHLSQLSTQIHALETTLAAGAPFDSARVEALKQAIADGELAIHPEVIADKMIAGDLALLTGNKG